MTERKRSGDPKSSKRRGKERPATRTAGTATLARLAADETPEARARREAIEGREAQIRILQRAENEISSRFGMPGEDEEELENQRGEIRRMIGDLERELEDLRASVSMNFPGPGEIQSLGTAMDRLEARMATNAAVVAIVEASEAVMDAFGI